MFVFISVYCGLCKCNRSYHCESAWSHPEPRSDPRSRPDSTVMGDRTGSPVGDYDIKIFFVVLCDCVCFCFRCVVCGVWCVCGVCVLFEACLVVHCR